MIVLRAHHLLCLDQFRGLGYSPFFIANLARVQRMLAEPGAVVRLTAGPDAICAACPFLDGVACRRGAGAADRDRLVLSRLGLTPNTRLSWAGLKEVFEAALPPAARPAVCAGCTWLTAGVCYR
ncbi:MAG: DUF1284 domain-containing protein [Desulfotomaculales bacterium]